MEKKLKALFFVTLLFFVISYITVGVSDRLTGFIAVLLIIVSFVAGVLAFIVQITLLVFNMTVSLPIISTIYSIIIGIVAKIHYILFSYVLKVAVKETDRYKRIHDRIVVSGIYLWIMNFSRRILAGFGKKKAMEIRLFETISCAACKKKIPGYGKYCPYCGKCFENH